MTVSKFSRNEISQLYGIQSDRIDIVYNSADTTFKNIRTENKEKYILAVSSLHYQKNFHSLIEAFDGLGDENIKFFQYLETITKIADKGKHTFVIGEVPMTKI